MSGNTDSRELQHARDSEAEFVRLPGETETEDGSRRRAARYRVELDVTLSSEHNFYTGLVENISQGGVFIATHRPQSIGDVMDLSIRIPNSTNVIRGTGEVRWIRDFSEQSNTPPGVGVRFLELDPDSIEIVEQFLARREPILFDEG